VTIWQSWGVSKGNVHGIIFLLHKCKRITSLITMPLTEMIGIVQTTWRQSARIDTTWNFLLGVGQGNPRSVCCGVFSYQKWHWTKTVETMFGSPFWPSRLSDRSGAVCNELRNWSPVGWWIRRKTELYATKPFRPMRLQQMFFCLKGVTTSIAHPQKKKAKVTVEYKCGTRVTTNKCTNVRVNLGMKSGKNCRMCYRKQLTTELSSKDRQQRCRTSDMGCPICKEPICKECWKEGYDRHA
jgi:hypothetical protein